MNFTISIFQIELKSTRHRLELNFFRLFIAFSWENAKKVEQKLLASQFLMNFTILIFRIDSKSTFSDLFLHFPGENAKESRTKIDCESISNEFHDSDFPNRLEIDAKSAFCRFFLAFSCENAS